MQWREADGVRWLEANISNARAAFGTRLDVREGENRDRLAAALGREARGIVRARQVHGADVLRHERRQDPGAELPGADGNAVASGDLTPLVLVADCLPIAVAGPGGVAMLHGGWRGLAAGIIEAGVAAVGATSAAVGPGIGPCCYEVGNEVLSQFARLGDGLADESMLDLRAIAKRMLADAGVGDVEVSELCTRCNPDLFYSYRREGERAGRQGGVAWLS